VGQRVDISNLPCVFLAGRGPACTPFPPLVGKANVLNPYSNLVESVVHENLTG